MALVAIGVGSWLVAHNGQIRWATETALLKVLQLAEKEDGFAAFALARRVESYIPDNPILAHAWPQISRIVTVETDPEGADVYRKQYQDVQGEWEHLGRTPIQSLRVARGYSRWKIVKTGYETIETGGNNVDGSSFPQPPETLCCSRPKQYPKAWCTWMAEQHV